MQSINISHHFPRPKVVTSSRSENIEPVPTVLTSPPKNPFQPDFPSPSICFCIAIKENLFTSHIGSSTSPSLPPLHPSTRPPSPRPSHPPTISYLLTTSLIILIYRIDFIRKHQQKFNASIDILGLTFP